MVDDAVVRAVHGVVGLGLQLQVRLHAHAGRQLPEEPRLVQVAPLLLQVRVVPQQLVAT